MRYRFWLSRAVLAAFCLAPLSKLYAIAAVTLDETQEGATTEYSLLNNSQTTANPFDIAALVVSTTSASPSPTTSNANWFAESLTSTSWGQTMGFPRVVEPALPTWQQYTGLTFSQAFPTAPAGVNGYFLNYTYNSGSGDVSYPGNPNYPGNPAFGGFFFQGAPDSSFLVFGPPDGQTNAPLGQLLSFEGTAQIVPEPGALSLCLAALGCAAALVRRKRRS